MKHLTFTFMSDFTYNRVGYVDIDLDDLDALGARGADQPDRRGAGQAGPGRRPAGPSTAIKGLVLGVDHAATRILAGDREHALLEYLTVVPYYFWGAYNIHEMNSSTNVTRHPDIGDEKKSPARVFTANNTPSIVNSFDNLPMPTEDFVRNFGRRMHHIAMAVMDGHVVDEKNVDYVVRQLAEMGTPFLAQGRGGVQGGPQPQADLLQELAATRCSSPSTSSAATTSRASSPATTSHPSPRPPAPTSATSTATSSTERARSLGAHPTLSEQGEHHDRTHPHQGPVGGHRPRPAGDPARRPGQPVVVAPGDPVRAAGAAGDLRLLPAQAQHPAQLPARRPDAVPAGGHGARAAPVPRGERHRRPTLRPRHPLGDLPAGQERRRTRSRSAPSTTCTTPATAG